MKNDFNFSKISENNIPVKESIVINKYSEISFYMDIFIAFFDLVVVTILYYEHFEYLKKLEITESGNILRIICLIISFLIVAIQIIRDILQKSVFTISKLLNIALHLIQPYPSVQFNWDMNILSREVTYNINIIFFLICMLRLKTLYTAIKYWYYYSSDKSKRILSFYGGKNIDIFVYKVIIKLNSFLALGIILSLTIYISALIFKVLENLDSNEKYEFGNFYNCLWFIFSTTSGIGYGDFFPKTLVGKIVIVLCCLIGAFLLSLVTATLFILTQFNEDENKAYANINLLNEQTNKDNFFTDYFNSYIKYKISKIRKKFSIVRMIKNKDDYTKNRIKVFFQVMKKLRETLSITSFCEITRDIWDKKIYKIIETLDICLIDLLEYSDLIYNKSTENKKNHQESLKYSNKIFNLAASMRYLGCNFEIESK